MKTRSHMESSPTIDLRIYDLCKNKLKLTESDATAVSKDLQAMVEEERGILLKQYLEAERKDRQKLEEFIDQRIDYLRRDVHTMQESSYVQQKRMVNSGEYSDILQWMFTYFAFLMGGLVAVLLLLLKK